MDSEILHFGHLGAEKIKFELGVMVKKTVSQFFWDTLYFLCFSFQFETEDCNNIIPQLFTD